MKFYPYKKRGVRKSFSHVEGVVTKDFWAVLAILKGGRVQMVSNFKDEGGGGGATSFTLC